LGKLTSKEQQCYVFATEENKQEKVVSDMAYLRVILILVNRVYEEKALLNSRFQIIFMSRDTATVNKIT